MNKLGFYIENTTVTFLREALREVKPPTIVVHAGDRGLLREIREQLSPNAYVVGRLFVDLQQQLAWLDSADPAAAGRAYADRVLNYDFGLATEKANGRLLIDAWMSLNEVLPGPDTFPSGQPDDTWRRRAAALDTFQVAFRQRLLSEGIEAVAFNFAAGNYARPENYLDWFPQTLATYIYLGFHEYGWPTLKPSPVSATGALLYRPVMEGIRRVYGDRHRAIMTEAGLARMYKYPNDPAGDVGWQYAGETIPQPMYWESLQWYNGEMGKDAYVLGCCLFQVGHSGQWYTFRHLGETNDQKPITIIPQIATLNDAPPPPPPEAPRATVDLATLQRRIRELTATLEAASQQLTTYVDQVARLQADLNGLAVLATESAGMPDELNRLQGRLDRLGAQVGLLEQQGQLSAAQAAAFRQRIADLSGRVAALRSAAQQAATLDAQVRQAQSQMPPLTDGAAAAGRLKPQVNTLLAEARRLATAAGVPPRVSQPAGLEDLRGELPEQPTPGREEQPAEAQVTEGEMLPETTSNLAEQLMPPPPPIGAGQGYPTRSLDRITQVIVHHTNTRLDAGPERIAEIDLKQGLPGIKYHFLVDGDGASFWTQPLESVLPQTGVKQVNLTGVAVALAGNFSKTAPSDAQLQAAAEIVAWLLSRFDLPLDRVVGRSEVQPNVISPGAQWLQGVVFKVSLLERVEATLTESRWGY